MKTGKYTSPRRQPSVDETLRESLRHIERLGAHLNHGDSFPHLDALGEIGMLLAALPLNTDEFSLAGNRLRNAARYLTSGERGAACYELKLLSRCLSNNQYHKMAHQRHVMR